MEREEKRKGKEGKGKGRKGRKDEGRLAQEETGTKEKEGSRKEEREADERPVWVGWGGGGKGSGKRVPEWHGMVLGFFRSCVSLVGRGIKIRDQIREGDGEGGGMVAEGRERSEG